MWSSSTTKIVALLLAAAGLAVAQSGNNEIVWPWKVSTRTPGGNIPVWVKYRVTVDATNWLVNGSPAPSGEGAVAAKASGTHQKVNLFLVPAGGIVEALHVRRQVACTGVSTVTLTSVGDACGATSYFSTSYNLHTAPTNTDMRTSTSTPRRCTIVAHYLQMYFDTTGGNIVDLENCVVDFWVKWSMLP